MTRHSTVPFAVLTLLAAISCRARAHDPGLSSLTLQRAGQAFEYRVLVSDADLPEPRRRCQTRGLLAVMWNDRPVDLTPRCRAYDANHTAFEGRFELRGAGDLTLQLPLLAELPRGHRSYARVLDERGRVLAQRLLGEPWATLRTQLSNDATPGFLALGVEHIATGFDHLLFLTLLLLNVTTWRAMFTVVSCFTLAHSATLALASLAQFVLPSRPVEIAIALSVVWVAARNCMAKAHARERLTTTFAFGLVHGLGFAGALRELGVTGAGLATLRPLALFNLGVELGQLAFGALFVALCMHLRRRRWSSAYARAVSAVAVLVGLVWLLDRALWL